MRNKNQVNRRNALIKQRYNTLAAKRDGNVRVYTHEYILSKLSKKFFLQPAYIGQILTDNTGTAPPKPDPNQLELFS